MKIEYLQKIITRIQSQICCPKCKAKFAAENIDIIAVNGNQVEFSALCDCCEAKSHISAEIGLNQKPEKIRPVAPNGFVHIPKGKINQESLKGLKEDLKTFKGKDIKNLFKF